jgi:hypothetical protein
VLKTPNKKARPQNGSGLLKAFASGYTLRRSRIPLVNNRPCRTPGFGSDGKEDVSGIVTHDEDNMDMNVMIRQQG